MIKSLFRLACVLVPIGMLQGDEIDRGRYLLVEVAHCQDCHTRRGGSETDSSSWLRGMRIERSCGLNGLPQAEQAPDITPAGTLWKQWGERGMLRFLRTGADPDNRSAQSPMPAYRLRPDDARAIIAYLKSLR